MAYTDLKGKTALITGAGKANGIGYAIAEKLASCGTDIIIADLGRAPQEEDVLKPGSREEMDGLAEDLAGRFSVQTLAVELDVTSRASIEAMMAVVRERFPHIHILVNNAGAAFGAPSTVHEYDESAWLKTFDVNLHGIYRVCRAVVPMMLGQPGAIVNMASKAGKCPPLLNPAYAIAKAGVIMLTKEMALDLASHQIRSNAICPGLIMTDLQDLRIRMEAQFYGTTYEAAMDRLSSTVPLKRLGTPQEVADLAAFLASDASAYITGQAMNIGGGVMMEL